MIVKVTISDVSISHKGVLYTLNDEIDVSDKEYDEVKEFVEILDDGEMSYTDLRDAAKAKGIKGFHKMSADELREALGVE